MVEVVIKFGQVVSILFNDGRSWKLGCSRIRVYSVAGNETVHSLEGGHSYSGGQGVVG